jgi:DNA-binding XRE family transcriptional regulator
MGFGEIVRGHRQRMGLTQEELADKARVSVRTIRALEGDRIGRPRPGTVRLLAEAFALQGIDRNRFHESAAACGNDHQDGCTGTSSGPARRRPAGTDVEVDAGEQVLGEDVDGLAAADPANSIGRLSAATKIQVAAVAVVTIALVTLVMARFGGGASGQSRPTTESLIAEVTGTWKGILVQSDGRRWRMELHVNEGGLTGTTTYPELRCVGWAGITEIGVATLRYHEHIESGSCTPDGSITLRRRSGGQIDLYYVPEGDVYTASAVLSRSK